MEETARKTGNGARTDMLHWAVKTKQVWFIMPVWRMKKPDTGDTTLQLQKWKPIQTIPLRGGGSNTDTFLCLLTQNNGLLWPWNVHIRTKGQTSIQGKLPIWQVSTLCEPTHLVNVVIVPEPWQALQFPHYGGNTHQYTVYVIIILHLP